MLSASRSITSVGSRLLTLVFALCCVAEGLCSSRAVGEEPASCVAVALCLIVLDVSWTAGLGLLFTTSALVFAAAMAARTEKRKRLAFIFFVSRMGPVTEATVIDECRKKESMIIVVMCQLTYLALRDLGLYLYS